MALPKGHEKLKTDKSYWKMSQMKEGENRLRIVKEPICGWLDWQDKKPIRYTTENKPARPFDPASPLKPFWDLYVWDYAREALFVLEITQSSILKALTKMEQDEDWGDCMKYDIKITKEGSGKDTRYSVTPLPHKPLSAKIEEALKRSPVRLEALYEGGDPWTDLEPIVNVDTGELSEVVVNAEMTPMEQLEELLSSEGIDPAYLQDFIDDIAARKKKPTTQIMEGMLIPEMRNTFKEHYLKYQKAVQKSA